MTGLATPNLDVPHAQAKPPRNHTQSNFKRWILDQYGRGTRKSSDHLPRMGKETGNVLCVWMRPGTRTWCHKKVGTLLGPDLLRSLEVKTTRYIYQNRRKDSAACVLGDCIMLLFKQEKATNNWKISEAVRKTGFCEICYWIDPPVGKRNQLFLQDWGFNSKLENQRLMNDVKNKKARQNNDVLLRRFCEENTLTVKWVLLKPCWQLSAKLWISMHFYWISDWD